MTGGDWFALALLALVFLTPPRRSKRFSRIQWSAYTEREDSPLGESVTRRVVDPVEVASMPGGPRSAYAFSEIGASDPAQATTRSGSRIAPRPPLASMHGSSASLSPTTGTELTANRSGAPLRPVVGHPPRDGS